MHFFAAIITIMHLAMVIYGLNRRQRLNLIYNWFPGIGCGIIGFTMVIAHRNEPTGMLLCLLAMMSFGVTSWLVQNVSMPEVSEAK